jgi:hypothetical protein
MEIRICEREPEVVNALRTGHWSAELRDHTASCESCADALLVAAALLESAPPSSTAPAGLAWWKAQLRLKRENAARAQKPLVMAEWGAAALLAAALASVLVWAGGAGFAACAAALLVFALAAVSALVFAASRG